MRARARGVAADSSLVILGTKSGKVYIGWSTWALLTVFAFGWLLGFTSVWIYFFYLSFSSN